jgi:DNA-binding NarL/FixJ family response regulator
MGSLCCLAGIDPGAVPMFRAVCRAVGVRMARAASRLDVAELHAAAPGLLVCDVDGSDVDPLELLRQIRFVLPDCTIAVFTGNTQRAWGAACHLAGANCVLAKTSRERRLVAGLRGALLSGCYTDPRFAA